MKVLDLPKEDKDMVIQVAEPRQKINFTTINFIGTQRVDIKLTPEKFWNYGFSGDKYYLTRNEYPDITLILSPEDFIGLFRIVEKDLVETLVK